MSISAALAIYFLIWWVTLFAVLPWGARSQDDSGEVTLGTDPGAPAVHRVWIKLVWTTLIAGVLFAVLIALYQAGLIPIHSLVSLAGPPHD
jgi:predicted secreted protein